VETQNQNPWQTLFLEELDRQDRIREDIDRLPEPERSVRRQEEQQRQKQWRIDNPRPVRGEVQGGDGGSPDGSSTSSNVSSSGLMIKPPISETGGDAGSQSQPHDSSQELSPLTEPPGPANTRRWTMGRLRFSRRKNS